MLSYGSVCLWSLVICSWGWGLMLISVVVHAVVLFWRGCWIRGLGRRDHHYSWTRRGGGMLMSLVLHRTFIHSS